MLFRSDDPKHDDLLDDTINILTKKSNFPEPVVLACKCLSDYLTDNDLALKHANRKVDEGLVNTLNEIQGNYLDNPEVIQATTELLSKMALRKPVLKDRMELFGRGRNALDSLNSGNKLFKPKGGVGKGKRAADDLQSKDAIKHMLDNFHKNLKNYDKNKDNILENEKDINDATPNVKSVEPLLSRQFVDDLNKAVDFTTKDPDDSPKKIGRAHV